MLNRFQRRARRPSREEFDELKRELREERNARRELEGELVSVKRALKAVPGLPGGEAPAVITVGGQSAKLRPLPAKAWLEALGELPGFLYAHARAQVADEELDPEELEKLVLRVREWLRACLAPEDLERVDLDELTVPEAAHGLGVMARQNGLDENLAAFFRERGVPRGAGHGVSEVRSAPEQAPPS